MRPPRLFIGFSSARIYDDKWFLEDCELYFGRKKEKNGRILMISRIEIENFKSIERIEVDCKRVNILIGPPDCGKTNFLEALGFTSWLAFGSAPLAQFVRLFRPYNAFSLYYRGRRNNPFIVELGSLRLSSNYKSNEALTIKFHNDGVGDSTFDVNVDSTHNLAYQQLFRSFSSIKYYGPLTQITPTIISGPDYVMPPFGSNLVHLISRNVAGLLEYAQSLMESSGIKLTLDQFNQQWVLVQPEEKAFQIYPLNVLSDTYKRLIFYAAVLKTSEDNDVIIIDEPDVFAFPPYPKMLGEMIGLNQKKTQFFLTTHNPYFLMAVLSKTPVDDLAVMVASRQKNGPTQIKTLVTHEQIQKLLDLDVDVFFNLEDI
ncbi:MAG: AAA family ATPase [Elusimicrobia bacterium]|nr:AAA family ATPase [Elusimicrobiota bacterium]